jgi:hypothetical protein
VTFTDPKHSPCKFEIGRDMAWAVGHRLTTEEASVLLRVLQFHPVRSLPMPHSNNSFIYHSHYITLATEKFVNWNTSPSISLNFAILSLPALRYACQNHHLEVTKSASSVFRVGVWCNTSGCGGWSLMLQPCTRNSCYNQCRRGDI